MRCVSPWSVLLLLVVMAACSMLAIADHVAAGDARPAEDIFAEMENRMLQASVISGRFSVSASGAFSASLRGTLEMSHGAGTDLQATGSFGEDSVAVFLRSDGRSMEGGHAERTFLEQTPAGLTEALILGFTRMGILHNLARLSGGAIPDRADGGVRDWVEVRNVHFGPDPDQDGLPSGMTALSFEIHVAGEQAAEATLWLDPDTGWPVHRRQVVTFPGGRMMVTEGYDLTIGSE
jgi:hypothetical protein